MEEDRYLARFTWFWLDDFELFHQAYDLTDKRVEAACRQGFTHLIIFGNHSRWNFQKWWNVINDGIAAVVRSAHKRGMKVIEHHSSCLVWQTDTPKRMEAALNNFRAWKMDIKNYDGFFELLSDPEYYHRNWVQINGDGDAVPSPYNGFAYCFNNPDYRKAYLKYLESIYATGVDGIMTDDVQYWGQTCNCPHCRRIFAEKYGFQLPDAGKWSAFFKRLDVPGALEQLKFRSESTHDFHVLVKEHYESLGLKMLRPNYSAAMLARDWTSISLEDMPALDWFFIECCNGSIPRYAWPAWLMEHSQRVMQANERNIPPMLLTYCGTPSDLMLSFSMARLTGSLYTNTTVGEAGPDETLLRNFEKRYAKWCFRTKPLQEIGVYYSRASKNFGIGYEAGRFMSWVQGMVVSNVPFRLIDADAHAIPEDCSVILLIDIRMLSDEEAASLRRAAASGKTVIVAGLCGDERPDGTFRNEEQYRELWGWKQEDVPEQGFREYPLGKGKLVAVGELFGRPASPEKWRKILDDKYWLFSAEEPSYTYDAVILSNSPKRGTTTATYLGRYLEMKPVFEQLASMLERYNPNPRFKAVGLPELVLSYAAECPGEGVVVHLANFAGTIDLPAGTEIHRGDQMPWPELKGTAFLQIKGNCQKAKAIFIDGREEALNVTQDNETGYAVVEFPMELLHDYAMVIASC